MTQPAGANIYYNEIKFYGDFGKELEYSPDDVRLFSVPPQYHFMTMNKDDIVFELQKIPFDVTKYELATEMLKAILNTINNSNVFMFDPAVNAINFANIMTCEPNGTVSYPTPNRPFDYWTMKEFEKVWKKYRNGEKV